MTGPRIDPTFDRARAKRDGWTDAEIDAFLAEEQAGSDPLKPTSPRVRSDATGVTSVKPDGRMYANDPIQIARAVGQGATLGFADEIEGGARALVSKTPYANIVSDIRAKNKQYADENPLANAGAQLGGGLLTGGGIAKTLGGAAKSAAGLSTGGKIMQAVKTGAKVGAATGAIAGAGSGESVEGRVQGAVVGAGLGGVLGGAMGGVAESASNYRDIASWMRDMMGKTTGEAARRRALEKITTDLQRAGLSPDQVRAQLQEVPTDVPYTLLDVGGQNVRDRGAAAAAVPGRGKETLTTTLTARRRGEGERVVNAFKGATGAEPDEVNMTTAAMEKVRGEAANREYGAAREAGKALMPKEYRSLLESPTIRKVYADVTDQLAEAGKEIVPLYHGDMVMDHPNVETLDYVYRALRDKARSASKADRSLAAREYKVLAGKVKNLLDDPALGVPEYTAARQNFAKASQKIDARREGEKFAKLQPEEIGATLQTLPEDVQGQYRAGAVRNVFERVQQRGPRTAVSKVDGNDQMRAQNRALAGPTRAPELDKRLDAEHTMGETYNKVLTGSRTTPLKEGVEDLGGSQWDKASDMLDMLATQPNKAGIVKRIKDAVQNRALAGRGEVAEHLGTMLTQGSTSRVDLERLLESIQNFASTQMVRRAATAPVGPSRASAVAGYTSGRFGSGK